MIGRRCRADRPGGCCHLTKPRSRALLGPCESGGSATRVVIAEQHAVRVPCRVDRRPDGASSDRKCEAALHAASMNTRQSVAHDLVGGSERCEGDANALDTSVAAVELIGDFTAARRRRRSRRLGSVPMWDRHQKLVAKQSTTMSPRVWPSRGGRRHRQYPVPTEWPGCRCTLKCEVQNITAIRRGRDGVGQQRNNCDGREAGERIGRRRCSGSSRLRSEGGSSLEPEASCSSRCRRDTRHRVRSRLIDHLHLAAPRALSRIASRSRRTRFRYSPE